MIFITQWARLCFNKTLLTNIEFCIIFLGHETLLSSDSIFVVGKCQECLGSSSVHKVLLFNASNTERGGGKEGDEEEECLQN